MEVNFDNADLDHEGIYEGILSVDDDGEYWLSQSQKPVKLHTSGLDEDVLENRVGEPVSVVGMLNITHDRGSMFSFELGARRLAHFQGLNPENDTYVSSLGGLDLEAYSDGLERFEGDYDDLIEDVEDVRYT